MTGFGMETAYQGLHIGIKQKPKTNTDWRGKYG